MDDVSFLEAWQQWSAGHSVSDKSLWGLKILWWARAGMLLQCIAGFAIIAEIVGPDRLRQFGASLHELVTVPTLFRGLKYCILLLLKYLLVPLASAVLIQLATWLTLLGFDSDGLIRIDKSMREKVEGAYRASSQEAKWAATTVYRGSIVVGVFVGLWIISYPYRTNFSRPFVWWHMVAAIFIFSAFAAATVGPLLTALVIILFALAALVFDFAVITPMAWILERPYLGNLVRIGSLLLLVAGFALDWLGS